MEDFLAGLQRWKIKGNKSVGNEGQRDERVGFNLV